MPPTLDRAAREAREPHKTNADASFEGGRRPDTREPPTTVFLTQPIWAVRQRAIASFRLRALMFADDGRAEAREGAPGEATTREVIARDLQVLDRALAILADSEARFGLYAPIRIRTLNSIPGRQAVLARLRSSQVRTREALVLCLQGLDPGVPLMVLETAVAALRPFCLGVAGRALSLGANLSAWTGARLSAVAFDFNDLRPEDEAELPQALSRFAAMAAGLGATLVGDSLTTRAQVIAAWASGFTHLSGDVLESRTGPSLKPIRFDAADLYLDRKPPLFGAQA
jgi:hypothetical protein